MFTGLIEDVGELVRLRAESQAAKLELRTALPLADVQVGDSIAVNGACLTVEAVNASAGTLVFHALTETLQRTNLAQCRQGSLLNLERALRLGDRLGGHLVLGHVDTTAAVLRIGRGADDILLAVALPAELSALLIPKGSIAVDGISLTVAELTSSEFTAHIIPHTWHATNLRAVKAGDSVNLEADMVGKYIVRRSSVAAAAGVSMDDLARAGFL